MSGIGDCAVESKIQCAPGHGAVLAEEWFHTRAILPATPTPQRALNFL
jgi:hypothetical protein